MAASEELLVTEDALESMRAAAAASYPNQTGGVLVGVFADGQPWVTAAVEVPGEGSPTSYTVPAGAMPMAVEDARQRIDPRVGYLGEWHAHGDDTGPSERDRATMQALARHWLFGPAPYLLLARRRAGTYVVEAYHEPFTGPISVVPTGPLPADDLEDAVRVAGDGASRLVEAVRVAIAELEVWHRPLPPSQVGRWGGCELCWPGDGHWPCAAASVAADLQYALEELEEEGSDG